MDFVDEEITYLCSRILYVYKIVKPLSFGQLKEAVVVVKSPGSTIAEQESKALAGGFIIKLKTSDQGEREKMLKKVVKLTVAISLFIFTPGYGQNAVLKGRVIDKDNKPLQGALVKLIKAKTSQNTDQNGGFTFNINITGILQSKPLSDMISIHNGLLSYNVSGNRQQINIDVFDIKGQKVSSVKQEISGKGTCNSKVLPDGLPVAMYFLKLRIGNRSEVFRIMSLKNQIYSVSEQGEKSLLNQTFAASSVDTLEISKDGYQKTKQAVSSYSAQLADIILQKDPSNDEGLPPVVNGKKAKTTRYWDCCKPHCGWHSNMKMCDINGNVINDKNAKSGCDGGPAFQCMDYAPIEVNSKVSYGWVAFNNSGTQCGDCFQLDFQGALSGKQMVVQVVNIGNGGLDAFDILIPGGGVGAMNGCSRQWNNAPLGVQYGGFRASCGPNADCIRGMCDKAFGSRADLMRGCNWYLGWFNMGDNPEVMYAKVTCPQKIKEISLIGN